MTRPRKREIVWGIRERGKLLPWLIRSTRKEIIGVLTESRETSWKEYRANGYSVHKLEVREVSK